MTIIGKHFSWMASTYNMSMTLIGEYKPLQTGAINITSFYMVTNLWTKDKLGLRGVSGIRI